MHWLMTTHVRRYLKYYRHSGHVWQGRFKAFATQDDEHLITAVRYVERSPLLARLVCRAEDWPWSSLGAWARAGIDESGHDNRWWPDQDNRWFVVKSAGA
jgi:putative transposase